MPRLLSNCCWKDPQGILDHNLHGVCSGCGKHAGFEGESYSPRVVDFKDPKDFTASALRFGDAIREPDEPEGTIEPVFVPDPDERRKSNLNRTIFQK